MKLFWQVLGIFAVLSALGTGFYTVGSIFGMFNEAVQVTREEFGPREMLRKYEWFKDAAAQLESKRSNIKASFAREKDLSSQYVGEKRKDWPEDDRREMGMLRAERVGMLASFNSLAAEYNAAMVKFNYAFANRGELPKGAGEPLPREFKRYMEE